MPEKLDCDLSWSRWNMCLWCFATTMMATDQQEDSEEEKDAATHSLFCERISAETGTGAQRRQRRERRERRERNAVNGDIAGNSERGLACEEPARTLVGRGSRKISQLYQGSG